MLEGCGPLDILRMGFSGMTKHARRPLARLNITGRFGHQVEVQFFGKVCGMKLVGLMSCITRFMLKM